MLLHISHHLDLTVISYLNSKLYSHCYKTLFLSFFLPKNEKWYSMVLEVDIKCIRWFERKYIQMSNLIIPCQIKCPNREIMNRLSRQRKLEKYRCQHYLLIPLTTIKFELIWQTFNIFIRNLMVYMYKKMEEEKLDIFIWGFSEIHIILNRVLNRCGRRIRRCLKAPVMIPSFVRDL